MFVPKLVVCLRTYSAQAFSRDLIAGLTVGVIALPLAMAFAIASGVGPERGLFTAVVAGLIISLLGGSRVQIGGPTGAFVIIVAGILAKHGYPGLVMVMWLAGALLIAMGLARFGAMIKFIPFPVVTGFTSGIAVVIFSSQVKDFLGLTMDTMPAEFFSRWAAFYRAIGTLNPAALAIGVGTVIVVFGLRRITPRVPGMLVAMVLATLAAKFFHLPVETIGSRFGALPHTLPAPTLPHFDFAMLPELISPALTVALLAGIESLLSATVADGMMGTRHKSNMELVATGVANIGSAIFGGIPATGAIARTATNVKSGGRTPVSGIIHAITLALILLLFAPLAQAVPMACLAGILVVVCYQMSEWEKFLRLMRSPRSDVMVLLSTFVLTVVVDLTVAVQVGVVMAALLFIRRMSEVTNIGVVTREFRDRDEEPDPNAVSLRSLPPDTEVFEINGPFFFGAAESFKETMRIVEKTPRVMILRMRNVPAIDATGLNLIHELHAGSHRDGTHLILSDVHAQPLVAFMTSDLWKEIGEKNILGNLDAAIARAHELLGTQPPSDDHHFPPTVARETSAETTP